MDNKDFVKYLGGFFDADGSVYISKRILRVRFSQSEKTVLDKINNYYNNIFRYITRNKDVDNTNVRSEFSLDLSGKALLPILKDLKENCIVKYPQICQAIEFTKYIGLQGYIDKKNEIENSVKDMNRDKDKYSNLRPYDRITTQYIAGLFDGDGYVGINEKSIGCHITQKSDSILLKKIHEIYPGSILTNIRVCFNKKEVLEKFLEDIEPFTIYKKLQALKTLEYLNTSSVNKKETLKHQVKILKKESLDIDKYTTYIKTIFEDINNNYTYDELLIYKKYLEIQTIRYQKNFNELIYNNFENLNHIKPKLIFCEERNELNMWLYYRNITSSIPYTGTVGRNIRILVKDEISNKYIGVMSLNSDIYNISCRDNYIKNNCNKEINSYINNIVNLNCCVPLQPFGFNTNGGKLLASLAFSKEVFDYYLNKYKEPLLAISTMSINGKSIMYDRLQNLKFIGFSKGISAVHIPKDVLHYCKMIYTYLGLKNKDNRVGSMDIMNVLLNYLKLSKKYLNHNIQRGYYFGWLFSTKFEENYYINELKTVDEISKWWYNRWCLNRYTKLKNDDKLNKEIKIYTESSKMFENLKEYKLPIHNDIVIVKNKQEMIEEVKVIPVKKVFLLQRCKEEHYKEIISLHKEKTTEEISKIVKEKYNITIPRNEISRFYKGEFTGELPDNIKNDKAYLDIINSDIKRINNKPKSDKFKDAIKNRNIEKRICTEEQIKQIMEDKLTAYSAKECGEKYIGRNGKNITEGVIKKIWTGKTLPLDGVSEDYQKLIDFKRIRKNFVKK